MLFFLRRFNYIIRLPVAPPRLERAKDRLLRIRTRAGRSRHGQGDFYGKGKGRPPTRCIGREVGTQHPEPNDVQGRERSAQFRLRVLRLLLGQGRKGNVERIHLQRMSAELPERRRKSAVTVLVLLKTRRGAAARAVCSSFSFLPGLLRQHTCRVVDHLPARRLIMPPQRLSWASTLPLPVR
jgi:hypothetical protein